MAEPPWQVGNEEQRWRGYLDSTTGDPNDPDTWILRNLVGARTWDELRIREDALVENRMVELAERPVSQTFDLDHLRALHHRLFQDVYEWAGELRTVNIAKGRPFLSREQIPGFIGELSAMLAQADYLRRADLDQFRGIAAEVCNAVNTAYPFRQGNGRTHRAFLGLIRKRGVCSSTRSSDRCGPVACPAHGTKARPLP